MKKVYIESLSRMICPSTFPASELKKELETLSGQKFRRINRYITLALNGVFKLPGVTALSPSASLYIGTKNGCITETVSMLGQMYRDALLPMPFTFIASSANMASYHIAHALGTQGGNYTLSHRHAPFECALEMAMYDLMADKTASTLVGCVDEAALPLDAFKEVVEMQEVSEPLEGGYWLSLSTSPVHPIAEIVEAKRFKTFEEIEHYLPKDMMIIRDDSHTRTNDYVGSNSGLEFISALEGNYREFALVTQMGKHQLSLIIVKNLSENDYN